MNNTHKIIFTISTIALFVGVMCISIPESDAATIDTMEYDDYREVPNTTTASGALEIVTIEGKTYIHAKSVGSGAYTTGWTTHNVNVVKADLIIVTLMGQSNGAYTFRANPDEVDVFSNLGECYYYGDSTSPVEYDLSEGATYGIYDMMDTPTDAHIGGVDEPLAVTLNKETGKKVLTINCCISGAKINKMLPHSAYYVWMQGRFSDAVSMIDLDCYNVVDTTMLWIQGETNPTSLIVDYKNWFNRIWNSLTHNTSEAEPDIFNSDYTFSSCVISLVRQNIGVNAVCAQIELANELDTVSLGIWSCDQFSGDLMYSDDVHYTQLGRNIVGQKCGMRLSEVLE